MAGIDQERPASQFGVFELDRRSGELRKLGIKVKLQEQPLQVLALLLEHPGQVVTRDDLRQRLWPLNTYVDYDNAINSAVRKLRDALGDNAENPRFIETLARRGYRFIAPVKKWEPKETVSLSSIAAPVPTRKRRNIVWIMTVALPVALGLGFGVRYWLTSRSDTPSESPAEPVPLTSYPGFQRFPTFSPEGSRVAFAWDEPGRRPSNIYVKLIGPSSEPVRLTDGVDGDIAPAWSPDGRTIAFLRARGPLQSALMLAPAVGGQERELVRLQLDATQTLYHWGWTAPTPYLAWSPDSKWLLALDQSGPHAPARIVRISAETGEKTILLSPLGPKAFDRGIAVGAGDGGIAVSPDGQELAFTHTVDAPNFVIYLLGLSAQMLPTGRPVRLRFDINQIGGLAWDRDGRSLVVTSNRRGTPELWRLPIKSSGQPVRLSVGGDDPSDVALSATGRHLVYSHWSDDWNVWRVGLGSAHSRPATPLLVSTRNDTRAAYSPDGRRIAFESGRSGNEEIWTSNADGSQTAQITSFGNAWAGSPTWSPDGKWLAFDGNAAGNWNIYTVSSTGGKPNRLTTNTALQIRPNWSHDGRWIYYCSSQSGGPQIWKQPPNGGKGIQITKKGGCEAIESADGKNIYYLKDDTTLWKVPSAGGEETQISGFRYGYGVQFTLGKNGVYFLDSFQATTLKFIDFRSNSVRIAAKLPGPVASGLSVSPD